ncbi:MAG: hypothetical protein IPJ17_02515 [Holophagales bacterium]|nr:MAG: hypothetical protein IPJ17_02515 [Holophagales bacterium]
MNAPTLLALAALAAAPPAPAPDSGLFPAQLVVDLESQTTAPYETFYSPPHFEAGPGGVVFFFQDDGVHGLELWRSDGTALGTYLVRDVCPGLCGVGSQSTYLGGLAAVGSSVFFAADDGVHGQELWISDGTALGTHQVLDINPGSAASLPRAFFAAGDQLFFAADDGVHGSELWRSDGTPGGTHLVADLSPGAPDTFISLFAVGAGTLFFGVPDDPGGGVWRTDGTAAGTLRLTEAKPGWSMFAKGFPFRCFADGRLLFAGTDGAGTELWISDGTVAGTVRLSDLAPGSESSNPDNFNLDSTGALIYFTTSPPTLGPSSWWKTDGTLGGTAAVPLPAGVEPIASSGAFERIGTRIFFRARDEAHGAELWRLDDDGSSELVADLLPGSGWGLTFPAWIGSLMANVGGRVVFFADDGVEGLELWSSDGTPGGTVRLTDLAPGASVPQLDYFVSLLPVPVSGGRLFFRDWTPSAGHRLWISDGSAPGSHVLRSLNSQTSSLFPLWSSDYPLDPLPGTGCVAAAGTRLVFSAETASRRTQSIWGTDGTAGGTERISLDPPPVESQLRPRCQSFGGQAVFYDTDGQDLLLRATDGTAAGTSTLAATVPGADDYARPDAFPLFVRGEGGWLGWIRGLLVQTDGTSGGTSTSSVASSDYYPVLLAPFGTGLAISGDGFLLSDGTNAGTSAILPPGGGYLQPWPEDLAPMGEVLLFAGTDAATGTELWRTDGTTVGTFRIADLWPGPASSFRRDSYTLLEDGLKKRIVSLDAVAVMTADDGVHGTELWRTDGTAGGTTLLKDIYPGSYPSTPRDLVRVGDVVYFTAEDELHGLELWVTDGTTDGTHLVRDLVPGAESSVPQELTEVRGRLYFTAWRPSWGREAFQSDGTEAGTLQVSDVWPGTGSSSPSRFAAVRDTLYFAANDGTHGFELFKVIDSTLLDVFADGFEGGSLDRWSRVAAP